MTMPPPSDGTAQPQNHDPLDFTKGSYSGPAPATAQPKIKKRLKLEPEPNSQLSLLFHQLPELEAAKKEAEEKLAAHKKKIQQEIARSIENPEDLPDQFDIPADPFGGYPAYTLAARDGALRLNAEAMKAQDRATYDKWAVRGQPYWELARVKKNWVKR